MAIAWIATRSEPHLIEAFHTAHWEIKAFEPVEFIQANLSELRKVEVIVFELLDGSLLNLCQEICQKKIAPVFVIVTDLAYAQAALEAGVDDFLIAPVNPIEVILRVRKLARASSYVHVGQLEIDLSAWRVTMSGHRVQLSPIEFRLLACLAKRVGQLVSHATILEEVWGWEIETGILAQVKTYVGRVRRKIEPDVRNPQYIISVAGEGYRLRNQRQWRGDQRDSESTDTRD